MLFITLFAIREAIVKRQMTIDAKTLESLIEQCQIIARLAGERIITVYNDKFEVVQKADNTPLTTADLEANRVIVDGLESLSFKAPILSEESAAISFSERTGWETYWLVDPLDGTREFIARNGEFSVNIALIHQGRPILGVVYAPILNIVYYAASGLGAWKQTGNDSPQKIHVRDLGPGASVVVARSRSPGTGPLMRRFLEKLGKHEEIPMGSALKSCLVAEGAADVYPKLGPTSEWDTGAAQCVVEEAGGRITDLKLRDLRYNTRESLINPHFLVFGSDKRQWKDYLPSGISMYPG